MSTVGIFIRKTYLVQISEQTIQKLFLPKNVSPVFGDKTAYLRQLPTLVQDFLLI